MRPSPQWGLLVVRVGLAGVLLWFGAQQLLHAADWVGYVPAYATSLSGLSAVTIVLANGSAEIAFGLLLLLGLFTRISALIMGVHLALIALSLGLNQIGVRDWGLAAALFGLAIAGPGMWSLD
ncbi:DoxX family membrane protein [Candidatus Kaiserbacteria bacterium]|nr:DoxX family membrane protein [Candidatus Kaiserbacteria bacterium]